ncbi:MAG: FixH family protein [Candidatus Marinimicrobia bacterium]|nr:FixH family protein [Candidatus Neomarinimicrobiota bacterium]
MVFFIGLAIWSFQGDVELVYDNYYEKDVVFEQQIRRVERTEALSVKPRIRYNRVSETVRLTFPSALEHINPAGELLLFRPSDLHMDRTFSLVFGADTVQVISTPGLEKGLWRAKLSWMNEGLEYYLEEPFIVQ